MNDELKKQMEAAMEEAKRNARAVAGANKMVRVSGRRIKLALKNREIPAVYYSCGAKGAPLIAGYHGGGFLFGGCALDDELWLAVSETLGADVVSIGYRQSPDYKWEDTLADSYESVIYLKENSGAFGFDPENISVMGQSAGGNLAAAVALKAGMSNEISLKNQILVYPFLDIYTDPDDKGDGSFSGVMPHIMNELHCSTEDAKNPLCSPFYASDDMLKNLPNTIVSVSEDDNLRPEAEKYSQRIKDAGIPVNIMLAEEMPHGYIENGFKKKLHESDLQFLGSSGARLYESGLLKKRSQETLDFIKEHMA